MLTENTITVLYDNDGHIQDGGHYHYQQQSSSNTFPVVSYFTIKSEDNNAVLYQPTMEVHTCTCCSMICVCLSV